MPAWVQVMVWLAGAAFCLMVLGLLLDATLQMDEIRKKERTLTDLQWEIEEEEKHYCGWCDHEMDVVDTKDNIVYYACPRCDAHFSTWKEEA